MRKNCWRSSGFKPIKKYLSSKDRQSGQSPDPCSFRRLQRHPDIRRCLHRRRLQRSLHLLFLQKHTGCSGRYHSGRASQTPARLSEARRLRPDSPVGMSGSGEEEKTSGMKLIKSPVQRVALFNSGDRKALYPGSKPFGSRPQSQPGA